MPKLKTNKGAAKRFRRTSTGFKHKRTGKNHLNMKKSNRRLRSLRGFKAVSDVDQSKLDDLIPYQSR